MLEKVKSKVKSRDCGEGVAAAVYQQSGSKFALLPLEEARTGRRLQPGTGILTWIVERGLESAKRVPFSSS